MSESREYYSRSEQYGDVYISQEVLEMIAGAAAVEVEGVTGLAGGSVSDQLLGRKKLSKGINVLWESDNITIDISIQIKYGSIIPEVARKVQEAIIANVEATSFQPSFHRPSANSGTFMMRIRVPVGTRVRWLRMMAMPLTPPGASWLGSRNRAMAAA